jgi:hypothetical protein
VQKAARESLAKTCRISENERQARRKQKNVYSWTAGAALSGLLPDEAGREERMLQRKHSSSMTSKEQKEIARLT